MNKADLHSAIDAFAAATRSQDATLQRLALGHLQTVIAPLPESWGAVQDTQPALELVE